MFPRSRLRTSIRTPGESYIDNAVLRTTYNPGRIGKVWPPPNAVAESPQGQVTVVKANDDEAWIHHKGEGETKTQVWTTGRHNREWPPQEVFLEYRDFCPHHMTGVQWPPEEYEVNSQAQTEILQKHLPIQKQQRQWPPPPPQYQTADA
ncbi:hypothetical protein L596_011186 [Steinernema carpocapsae]|uniref:Uncharacterized protein n=1 Tax=Steinernema carpocapsae TaxID=34508 RepID=A0A4V6A4G7_STECR|nr:hypothetical protein L596_011186 [Steinernema carpocapsae]